MSEPFLDRRLSISSEATLMSGSDNDMQELLHSIIDISKKTTSKMSSLTNALIKLASLQQELNSSISIIDSLQKEAAERISELRPLMFEAKFRNNHLDFKLPIDDKFSGSILEKTGNHVASFIASLPKILFQPDLYQLPDLGSDHELELAKIVNKYKSHDTSSLKFEMYTNVYHSESQRLKIASSRVNNLTNDIITYQHKIKEAEKIKTIYCDLLMDMRREIQTLTDRLFSLRKVPNNTKDSMIIDDNSDDDGYYTPDEVDEQFL